MKKASYLQGKLAVSGWDRGIPEVPEALTQVTVTLARREAAVRPWRRCSCWHSSWRGRCSESSPGKRNKERIKSFGYQNEIEPEREDTDHQKDEIKAQREKHKGNAKARRNLLAVACEAAAALPWAPLARRQRGYWQTQLLVSQAS